MNWISIKESLPDWDVRVLWLMEDGFMFIDEIDHDNDWENFKNTHEKMGWVNQKDELPRTLITHWMPLPNPPHKTTLTEQN